MQQQLVHSTPATNLADILERALDKGIVIAGDIKIQLAEVELLTIKIRLLIASVERAREMGITWWESDGYLSPKAEERELVEKNKQLEARIRALEENTKRSAFPLTD